MESAAYTTTKPGSAGRTLFCAVLYLFIVLALAASLSRNRAQERLGGRITIPPWQLSFRVPKAFAPYDVPFQIGGEILPFATFLPNGGTAIVAVRRFPVSSGMDPASVCRELVRGHIAGGEAGQVTPLPIPSPAPIGPYQGVEIIDSRRSVLVRVALPGGALGLAVELVVQGALIDEALYELFDQMSRSIQEENT